jgi:hypothetical protein
MLISLDRRLSTHSSHSHGPKATVQRMDLNCAVGAKLLDSQTRQVLGEHNAKRRAP